MYQAEDFGKKKKFYALVEFPYPSGAGLHVGTARSWVAMDAYSRKKRMEGYNVLYPMGWDAFGLPAENYALKMGVHPSKSVAENIDCFRKQCQSLGLSFDWSREVNTTDPDYYKWTQWIFLQLFKKGLAYQSEVAVNWCPFCKTNLADEEVLADGTHERCGKQTERRMQKQWLLKITKYADRLLDDLKLVDYSPKIASQQINWIGRSEGINIDYPLVGKSGYVSCYSTRPDTNFGATFIVVAPEHPRLKELITKENKKAAEEYIKQAKKKSELERINLEKEKTGVFTGSYVLNRVSGRKLPIWISDFAILTAGTGMVVGVPAHDKRDWEFAKKYGLEIIPVIKPKKSSSKAASFAEVATKAESADTWDYDKEPFLDIDEAEVFNSDFLNGLPALKAKEKIIEHLAKKGWGKRSVNFHLRDWVFSRQHYWGEPIPIIHCPKCGAVPVPERELPVELPYLEKYQPSGTGESPLANVTDWVNTTCPKCGGPGRRETDTMPNWAGSNWYFVAYCFASKLRNPKSEIRNPKQNSNSNDQNSKSFRNSDLEISASQNIFTASKDVLEYWLPVDLYQGGFEHTTLHLLYSRFIYKFLYDIKAVPTSEPYMKRRSHGIVLGSDNRKMSKSFGNVVNPDDIVAKFGADTLRLYEMFMGPFDQAIAWDDQSLQGCYRFLCRVWKLVRENVKEAKTPQNITIKLHQTIKKVSSDLEEMKFNTAVAAMMEFINVWSQGYLFTKDAALFFKILAPMAPHITEEIWSEVLGHGSSIHEQDWPIFDPKLVEEETATIIIQINGKVRGQVKVSFADRNSQTEIEKLAKTEVNVAKYLQGKKIKKTIFVPGRLINFVV